MKVIDHTKSCKDLLRRAAQIGVQKACHKTMAYANANEVPMRTGRLINSGYYELWQFNDVVSYKMSYGGSEGLAGRSQFASRLYENLKYSMDEKTGKAVLVRGEENSSIYSSGYKMGQLTYARHWHYNTPAGGFGYGRKAYYLSDPMDYKFPDFLIQEVQGAFHNIGLTTATMAGMPEEVWVPDEVSL